MEPGQPEAREQTIFNDALDRPAAEREAFLCDACYGDESLRARVEQLLAAHSSADSFLMEPPFLDDEEAPREYGLYDKDGDKDPLLGQQVGRYTILERLARGGMGVVYRAEQDAPRRSVALKLLRFTMADRFGRRRFQYEAQTLGKLRHPGIAQIYEAGSYQPPIEHGGTKGEELPFFAMEFIPDALPITDYVQTNRLSGPARLELFAQVCDAVHYGHQNGIIHRDLKPGNILVDASGHAKVIDFGVARTIDPEMTQITRATVAGHIVGTLQYMSPEQCSPGADMVVDTRTDVYSLGMVLYEMLTTQRPYDVRRSALHDAARIIREEAPKPPGQISSELRGDIETILLKTIEKDPEQRYASASELAADLRRFLNREPIAARPPSAIYQMKTFAKRHKFGVASAVAFVVLLAASTAGMSWLSVRLAEEKRTAQTETSRATAVQDFLHELFLSLTPAGNSRKEITVAEALDHASEDLEATPLSNPIAEADLRALIGEIYARTSQFHRSESHFRRSMELYHQALGPHHLDSLRTQAYLAHVLMELGETEEAVTLARDALGRARLIGTLDIAILHNAISVEGDAGHLEVALELADELLSAKRHSPGTKARHLLAAINLAARFATSSHDLERAKSLYDEAIQICRDNPEELGGMEGGFHGNLVYVLIQTGHYEDAISEATLAKELAIKGPGKKSQSYAAANSALISAFGESGQFSQILPLARENLAICLKLYGPDSLNVLSVRSQLGAALLEAELLDEAEECLTMTVSGYTKLLGPDHERTMTAEMNLINLISDRGDALGALDRWNNLLDRSSQKYGPTHYRTTKIRHHVAGAYAVAGQLGKAREIAEAAFKFDRDELGDTHGLTQWALDMLIGICGELGDNEAAAEYQRIKDSVGQ